MFSIWLIPSVFLILQSILQKVIVRARVGCEGCHCSERQRLLEGVLVPVVSYVVSSVDRKGWEEGDRKATLRTSLSFTLKMGTLGSEPGLEILLHSSWLGDPG